MLLPTLFVCLVLGLVGQANAVAITELRYANMTGLRNQWLITVETGKEGSNDFTPVNCGCNCALPGSCPNLPTLKNGEGDEVRITYAPNTTAGPFKTRNNLVPSYTEVKMCYSVVSAIDRGWRKKNRAYPRLDQGCAILIDGKQDFNPQGGSVILKIDEEDELPSAKWWFMVRTFCEVTPGKFEVCQWDSTETKNYVETKVELGITSGLVAATIIMSLFGPVFLIAYWFADHMYFTKTGKPLSFVGY